MYKRNAEALSKSLVEALGPDIALDVQLNPDGPKSKAFDIYVERGGEKTLIWNGKAKGPPRRLKVGTRLLVAQNPYSLRLSSRNPRQSSMRFELPWPNSLRNNTHTLSVQRALK